MSQPPAKGHEPKPARARVAVVERDSQPTQLPLLSTKRGPEPTRNSFVQGDAFEFLKSLPDESVDLVITDPPYESLELHRSRGTTTRLVGDWFHTVPNAKLGELLSEVARVLKPDRHFYLFCDEITSDVIKEQQGITSRRDADGARSCRCGLRYWRELIWAKTTRAGDRVHGGMGYHFRSASERIMFFEKGKRRLSDLGVPDVLLAPRPEHKAPAAKPLSLTETLVRQSSSLGELVIDPFAGSGVVAAAANAQGRDFLINDLDASFLLPDVAVLVGQQPRKFLFVEPRLADPEVLLEAILGDEPSKAAEHDRVMLQLDSDDGVAFLDELAQVRPLERASLFRRYIRSSMWMKAALSSSDAVGAKGKSWLAWVTRS